MNRLGSLCVGLSLVGAAGFVAAGSAGATDIFLHGNNVVVSPAGLAGLLGGGGWLAGVPDPDPDENEPDKSAWQVFVNINKAAPSQQQVGPNHVTTNNAIWETWADDGLTFPSNPNLNSPPQWPTGATTFPLKKLRLPFQNAFRQTMIERKSPAELKTLEMRLRTGHPEFQFRQLFTINPKAPPSGITPEILTVQTGGGEEVRRNKSSFDFIIGHKLWYTQGLAAAFSAGKTIVFPVDAIEIKARWKPIQESDKPNYHWNYDSNGTLYGLVAFHIMTKALPNWLWATWEWTGNPGRCDYIGCHDSFGQSPADVAPKTPLGGQYPAGTLTSGVLALFSSAGLGPEWKNYRLKGSQTLFTDTTAQPTLLGNSITEAGFVQSSSCITCHGQASVDKNGAPNPSFGFVAGGQSSNGPLLPSMFYTNTNPPKLQFLPIDFVWAVAGASAAP